MATLFPSNVMTFRSGNMEQRPGTHRSDGGEKQLETVTCHSFTSDNS